MHRIRVSALLATLPLLALPAVGSAQQAPLPAATGLDFRPTGMSLLVGCKAGIHRVRTELHAIDSVPPAQRTFANTIGRAEHASADLVDSVASYAFLYAVSPDADVRMASQMCSQQISKFGVDVGADAKIYADAVALSKPGVLTDPAERKVAELYVEQGRQAGAGVDSATRERVKGLFNRLNDLQRDYAVTIAADSTTITISAAEAKGIAPQLLANLKPAADGGFVVPVNESTTGPFLQTDASSAARARFVAAYWRRGGAGNVRRVEQALAVRDTLAQLLGFPNWAAYRLDTHMVKDPARVIAFLNQIDEQLYAKTKTELAAIAAVKLASGDSTPLMGSDIGYYNAMLRRTKYNVDNEEVRQYFPVDHVVSGVFGIYEQLLGVKFDEITPADAWAPGVREFAVSDAATKKPLGWIFLDLFPRPNKYEHFATFPIRTGIHWPDGKVDRPVSAIVGNWPTAAPGKPSLLSHADVITFFHEFGHLMAATLVDAQYPELVGLRQDFVEAPSQMLENWMWQPSVLARVSSNVKTGKPLPPDLIERMIALRQLGAGYTNSVQAFLAMYDMRLHSSTVPLDTKVTWDSLQARMMPGVSFTGDYPAASFAHIMGGYDAGYYGYLWSKAYAQDLFTRFEKEGVMNASTGMAYRRDVLEPGALREPDSLLQSFLGRPLNYDAFYRDLGITTHEGVASSGK